MRAPTIERRASLLPLPLPVFIGFAVAVLAVAVIGAVTFSAQQARARAAERVTHTLQALSALDELLSTLKDAETGQRGFVLTAEESYLEPYTQAEVALPGEFRRLHELIGSGAEQGRRLDMLERVAQSKMTELAATVAFKRSGDAAGALALVRTDRGRVSMERARELKAEMTRDESAQLAVAEGEWQRTIAISSWVTNAGSALLLFLIAAAAVTTSRDYRAREVLNWQRAGQAGLAAKLQGDQRLDTLGDHALSFLAQYLGACVGSAYVTTGSNTFRRFAGYALLPALGQPELIGPGSGLIGQAAKENRVLHVRRLPPEYLLVNSSLGQGSPRELLIAPAAVDGVVYAILELGFLTPARSADQELLAAIAHQLAVAVRAAKDRTRLEELLEETQRQAEELQMQQEELRVTNEELEVQSRALKVSQGQLEGQQAELEQTNSQLEEQTQLLEVQKDELLKGQRQLAEKAGDLQRANQYKSEFLANMSHELRTPLNSSLILARLLADNKGGNLSAEQVKFAQTILSAGNDLLTLINDVLDLAKIEAGKVEIEPSQVLLANLVDSLVKQFQPMALEKGLKFAVSFAPDAANQLQTDPQKLGQILKNLLSNALKFTERGEVTLRIGAGAAQSITFEVRDTGIGIAAHQQSVIFEAFRQADGSTHRRFGGTGLGLSISRDLARALGGQITLVSAPERGSTFTLTLPVTYVPAAAVPSVRTAPDAGRTPVSPALSAQSLTSSETGALPVFIEDDRDQILANSRLILIVEDDPSFASVLRELAHELGFVAIAAGTASDAVTAMKRYTFSGVLLDVNLPDRSGLGVLDQLKRDPRTRHIPVHVTSAADFTQEALELGAVSYAIKPVRREQLIDALQRLEAKISQHMRRVLIVEDDERQRDSIRELLGASDVMISAVANAEDALKELKSGSFDCVVMDLNLPDKSGYELLQSMAEQEDVAFPPVIVYTGRSLSSADEQRLRRFSKSIIIKDARSPERLLDEVTLFLHQVEANLPLDRQRMLRAVRDREAALEGRRILVVEDDVRNIFALSSLLEPKGANIEIARNGFEALEVLARCSTDPAKAIDLVLMDIMMPGMDGLTAMREIRKQPQYAKLPMIALTAKAMRDDQQQCLDAGASDYIAKPLDVEKLLSLVRVWMPKRAG